MESQSRKRFLCERYERRRVCICSRALQFSFALRVDPLAVQCAWLCSDMFDPP